MKKKFICLSALLIVACMTMTSCITSMFGDAGITQPNNITTPPALGGDTTEQSGGEEEPAFGSKPSYAGIKFEDYLKVDYKNLTIETDWLPPEVNDKIVDSLIVKDIDAYASILNCSMTLVKEGVVEAWDFVEIGFVGKINGEVFQDGSSKENVGMIVDDHYSGYIPGFAEGIIGAEIGKMVEVPVTFPDNYDEALAGKEAIFEITVYGKRVYDIKDEHIDKLTGGAYKTLNDLRKYYKDNLPADFKSQLLSEISGKLFEAILEKTEVYSYPQEQYLYYYNSNVSYMTKQAQKLGLSYEEYMTSTGETETTLRAKAEATVKEDMVIYYILELEGKTYTDEEYNEALDWYIEYYKSQGYSYDRKSIEQLFEYYYYPGYLRYQFNKERVIDTAFGSANVILAPNTDTPAEETTAEA